MMQKYIDKYGDLFFKQLEIETRYKEIGQDAVKREYANAKATPEGISRTKLGQKVIAWQYKEVKTNIADFMTQWLAPKAGTKPSYVSIIELMSNTYGADFDGLADMVTLITFSTLINSVLSKNNHHSNICQQINTELLDEVRLRAYLNTFKERHLSVTAGLDRRVQALYRRSYARARMEHDNFTFKGWSKAEGLQLAASLVHVVLETSNYFEQVQIGKEPLEIIPTQTLLKGWQVNEDKLISDAFRVCPTVIPPKPWEDVNTGGYYGDLMSKNKLLRLHGGGNNAFMLRYSKVLNQLALNDVRKAINAVQATPWRINQDVLAVLQVLVKRGGGIAGIPNMLEPLPPSVLPAAPTEEQKAEHSRIMQAWYRSETRRKSISLRCLANLRMAEEFKEFDRIYFPCNMDFRGRVYPIPAFSFQGDDLTKSLIEFADAPPCYSEDAYEWFLVEGANLAGVDKVSFDERKAWVLENEKNILSCAAHPLDNLWWAEQDCPCQMLAYCFEYAKMVDYRKAHNGSIIGWETGINIAFDGTCSGLQHFSAMLRDPIGADAVNLLPADKPKDIYAIVAAKVNEKLVVDARTGKLSEEVTDDNGRKYLKWGSRDLAQQWLAFGVTRKVTKRSVMTLAYGSKEYGFRDQIWVDTIQPDLDEKDDKSIFAGSRGQAAKYLAKLIWVAVGETVVKAVEGMKWLQTCAKAVCKDRQVVTWETPMGLLVQQSYMVTKSTVVQVRCAGKRLRLYDTEHTGDIDKHKQASGIAPNFVHSMDASHLQMAVCASYDVGIKHFAVIHDSFGAPLSQAQDLYRVIRETFIKMYEDFDVLENFKHDMELLTSVKIPKPPAKGSFDIKAVMESKYIFS